MTIQEANAVNVLLKYFVGEYGRRGTDEPWPENVRQAGDLLADEARRMLAEQA